MAPPGRLGRQLGLGALPRLYRAVAVAVPRRSAALAALAPGRLTSGVAGGLALVAAACYPGPLDVALMVKDAEVTARLTNQLGVATLGQLFEPFLL